MVASQRDMRFLGEAEDLEGALAAMKPVHPDVVLVDATLAGRDNAALLRCLAAFSPKARILAFGPRDGDEEISQLLDAGASGYVMQTAAVSEMTLAIREAHAGRRYLSIRVQAQLEERRRWPTLTGRQRDVLALLTEGRTNAGIAAVLNISPGTVKLHIKSILTKLGVEDRTRAVVVALRRGFARIS
jgi:DNA-binding NarL/FixJ family response regulator